MERTLKQSALPELCDYHRLKLCWMKQRLANNASCCFQIKDLDQHLQMVLEYEEEAKGELF